MDAATRKYLAEVRGSVRGKQTTNKRQKNDRDAKMEHGEPQAAVQMAGGDGKLGA